MAAGGLRSKSAPLKAFQHRPMSCPPPLTLLLIYSWSVFYHTYELWTNSSIRDQQQRVFFSSSLINRNEEL